jgi:hypothetical protein
VAVETVIWETLTGQELEIVEPSDGEWDRGRVVDKTHTFQIDALGLSAADRVDLFGENRPRDRALTHKVDGVPIYNGLILDWDYDDNAGTYAVTHTDVREILSGRFLYGVGGYHTDGVFAWSGLSWRGMAARALYYLLRYEDSPRWAMRVNLPPEEAGVEEFITWCYEMRLGESIIADIEKRPGGPDIDFQPVIFGDGGHGWDARIGSPFLTGPDIEVALGGDDSPVKNLKIKRRGRAVGTGAFGIGDGSEQRLQVAQVPTVNDRVIRDYKVTFKAETGTEPGGSLYGRTEGHLGARQTPTQHWSFDLDTAGVDLTTLRRGSIIYVTAENHRFAPDGETAHRVLGYAGSLAEPDTVKLTLETLQDAEDEDG